VHRLRFTTLVEAPLTVAFDVARTLGRPWPWPLQEVVSERPVRDVYAVGPG
jgi:8-oxo-dGTP diphosphatase